MSQIALDSGDIKVLREFIPVSPKEQMEARLFALKEGEKFKVSEMRGNKNKIIKKSSNYNKKLVKPERMF